MKLIPLLLVGFALVGCGGMVVFGADGDGGGGSAGAECVLGSCGDDCTKCSGDACYNGSCDDEGRCHPPDSPLACAE